MYIIQLSLNKTYRRCCRIYELLKLTVQRSVWFESVFETSSWAGEKIVHLGQAPVTTDVFHTIGRLQNSFSEEHGGHTLSAQAVSALQVAFTHSDFDILCPSTFQPILCFPFWLTSQLTFPAQFKLHTVTQGPEQPRRSRLYGRKPWLSNYGENGKSCFES